MKNYKFIFLFAGIFYSEVANSALTDILQKYCVPKNGSDCSVDVRGTYNEVGNFCACNSVLKHYNSTTRVCENCVTGSVASSDYKTCEPVNCPEGYKAVLITDGKCPAGFGLKQIANGTCPSSTGLKTWTYSTKSWK